ncbi:MAG TPA: amino acid-binding protein [Planctomycetota bacterium]|jgi:hypothetical protein
MNPAARKAWAGTKVVVSTERYVLVELAPGALDRSPVGINGGFSAIIHEADTVSLIVKESAWKSKERRARAVHGPLRLVTLEAELEPELAGYLSPAAVRLADAGIPIVPICGATRDHLLVRDVDVDRAAAMLEGLARDCGRPA